MRYVISYDLNKPGQDYDSLIEELKRHGAKKLLKSQWRLQRTGTSAEKLLDRFWKCMDRNDRLLVMCVDSGDLAAKNLINRLRRYSS